jgi:DNA (cytosine-5)-methyltransferase 1|nr:MAG TPA: Cytosine specific methyltransferase [Caudoviricetes sp.]
MKFIDFFSGVGGFTRGMELAGHKCIGHCEFDKYAEASYRSMHTITDKQREYLLTLPLKQRQKEILKNEYLNGEWYSDDICGVIAREIPKADCWCFGFPCQDISIAGKGKGFRGNRSGLFFRVTSLLRDLKEEDRPNTLFIENVRNLLSVNRGFDFARLLVELDKIGYDAEWQVINSKHHGVPQNRERVFIIGHLRGRGRREVFPIEGTDGGNRICQVGQYALNVKRKSPSAFRVFDTTGISPCLTTSGGEIKVKEAVKKGYTEATKGDSINVALPNSKTRRGRVGKQVAQTLDTSCNQAAVVEIAEDCKAWAIWSEKYNCYLAIRKLTPKECFRLQGWKDEYFEHAEQFNSNSQLYKQAGNGVTVTVIKDIAERI